MAESPTDHTPRVSRRTFLAGAAGITAGVVADEGARRIFGKKESESSVVESPRGKFLNISNVVLKKDGYVIASPQIEFTDKPDVLEVSAFHKIYGKGGFREGSYDGRVFFSHKPIVDISGINALEILASPVPAEEVKAKYVAPVFGDVVNPEFVEETTAALFYSQDISFKGVEVTGGIWFVLIDENGNYTDPDGLPLKSNDRPYYTRGFFIELKNDFPGLPTPNPTSITVPPMPSSSSEI